MRLLLLVFLLFCSPAWATTYYIAASGSGTTCSIGSPCADSYVDTISASPGDTIAFNKGDTFTLGHKITHFGTSGNPITYTSYGSGAKPIFNALTTFAPTWTLVSGAVYSSPMVAGMTSLNHKRVWVLTANGTRLNNTTWTTDVATTILGMSAGSYFIDYTNSLILVWLSDNSNPTGATIKYSPYQSYFNANTDASWIFGNQANAGYLTLDGLEMDYANSAAIQCGDGSTQAYACIGGITVQNCDFKYNGRSAIVASGAVTIANNTALDSGGNNFNSSNDAAADTGVYHINDSSNFTFTNNTSDITRYGSHVEISYRNTNGIISGNTLTRGSRQCLEVNGSPNSYVVFKNNYCDQRLNPYINLSAALMLFSNSSYATSYNNIFIGGTGGSSGISFNNVANNNVAVNNTVIRNSNTAGTSANLSSIDTSTTNTVKNNIFINNDLTNDTSIKCEQLTCGDWDYNLFYAATGTLRYRWHFGNATGLSGWQSASGLDAHSININPKLNNYTAGSPIYNAGVDLSIYGVTTDYYGNVRPYGTAYDIGAVEAQYGVKYNGVRVK